MPELDAKGLTAADLRERGQQALAQGAWAEARDYFEAAIDREEQPEALEGLSWAAWWLSDSATLFDARERAFHQFRANQDLQGAARMALWLSSDYLEFRGEAAVANGWRQRARRLLGAQGLTPEQGWLTLLEGDAALLIGDDTVTAKRCGREVADVGRRLDAADLQMLGLAMEGVALVCEGQLDDGMNRLDEAATAALAGEVREFICVLWTLCYLIYACERVRDYERAAQWCERMREFGRRFQVRIATGICRAHYGSILVWRGKWGDAETELSSATDDLRACRPPMAAEGLVRLADLRRRQGRLTEAEQILRQVDWHPLASLGLAELAIDHGNAMDAVELAEHVLRHVPLENQTQRAGALELLVRAQAAVGAHEQATATLHELHSICRAVNTLPLQAAASFAAGIIMAAQADRESARRAFEDAVMVFERAGAPFEAARARMELARVLSLMGRTAAAAQHALAAHASLHELGAMVEAERAQNLLRQVSRADQGEHDEERTRSSLTKRELEVLHLVAEGLGDREIADALTLSEHTVHRHIANIFGKLSVSSRAAAVAHAAHDGLL